MLGFVPNLRRFGAVFSSGTNLLSSGMEKLRRNIQKWLDRVTGNLLKSAVSHSRHGSSSRAALLDGHDDGLN